jgi:hypothetical protein
MPEVFNDKWKMENDKWKIITAPASVLGNFSGGHRAHRPMKRVSSAVFDGRQREWRPHLSKNVCEQFQSMDRRKFANAGQHIFEFERFSEKPISAGG